MSKKINILFTIPNFKTAGSQYVVLAIYKGLDRALFQPYILVEKFPNDFPKEIPKDEQFCIENNTTEKNYILKLRSFLKNHKIDILHSWDYKSSFSEAIACRISGVKYIYTKKNNAWSKRWFLKSFLASYIAYDNPVMYERFFKNSWLKNKVGFVPHGVDLTLFKPCPKKNEEDLKKFNIGCVGNLNTNKNQLFILKSLVHLPNHVNVFFYGNEDAHYRQILNDFIKENGLEQKVFFKGFIENKEIPVIIRQFDLFVLPSHNEGLPLCILESIASGVPVLSSNSGGGAKFILDEENGGYIFNLKKKHELVNQILELLNTNSIKYKKLVTRGLERAKDFTLEKEVNAYANLYLKMKKHG